MPLASPLKEQVGGLLVSIHAGRVVQGPEDGPTSPGNLSPKQGLTPTMHSPLLPVHWCPVPMFTPPFPLLFLPATGTFGGTPNGVLGSIPR